MTRVKILMLVLGVLGLSKSYACDDDCKKAANEGSGHVNGDRIAITARVESSKEGGYTKEYHFYPTSKVMSALDIRDPGLKLIFDAGEGYSSNITLVGPDGNKTKPTPFVRYDESSKRVYWPQYLNALVQLEKGTVARLQWDAAFDVPKMCVSDGERGLEAGCSLWKDVDAVKAKREQGTTSEIAYRIYLGLWGTDAKGVPLRAAEAMPSTFLKFHVGKVVDSMKKLVEDAQKVTNEVFK